MAAAAAARFVATGLGLLCRAAAAGLTRRAVGGGGGRRRRRRVVLDEYDGDGEGERRRRPRRLRFFLDSAPAAGAGARAWAAAADSLFTRCGGADAAGSSSSISSTLPSASALPPRLGGALGGSLHADQLEAVVGRPAAVPAWSAAARRPPPAPRRQASRAPASRRSASSALLPASPAIARVAG